MSILLINAQPMTGNISETVEKPKGKTKAFFEFEWTAGDAEDPEGTFSIRGGNSGTNWFEVSTASSNPDGTGAGTAFANVYEVAADKVNVLFTQTAGDSGALLSCWVNFE